MSTMNGIRISRTMSTQHPDNVHSPFFADSGVMEGDDEIKEAFYAFSHIKSREQLWDFEGKEVDNYVVKKLLSKYENFFSRNRLGKDMFLTLRVPNPDIERDESKILIETLESIPRSFDIAKAFYKDSDYPPIFEVALPMTTNALSVKRIRNYYSKIVVKKENTVVIEGDVPIKNWIGEFLPKEVNVIPLFEDMEGIMNAHAITEDYLKNMNGDTPEYQRVWLARSDPALNYGSVSAVIMNKIALQRLHELQEKISVEILPILGTGSAPFRGNLKPTNADKILKGYPSVQTYTIQSAFKYDYPEHDVFKAVENLEDSKRGKPVLVDDEQYFISLMNRVSLQYQKEISLMTDLINDFSSHIPARRKRKLHIGLFGYSRSFHGIKLPRAITFAATLYSMGLPPELLGLSALTSNDLDKLRNIYANIDEDINESMRFLNPDNLKYFPQEVSDSVEQIRGIFPMESDAKHRKITSIIMDDYKKKNFTMLKENILRAGAIRGCLG
jgi:phosphoenolpyruvate carboxylase